MVVTATLVVTTPRIGAALYRAVRPAPLDFAVLASPFVAATLVVTAMWIIIAPIG